MHRPDDIRAGLSIAPRRFGVAKSIAHRCAAWLRDPEVAGAMMALAFALWYGWMLGRIAR